MVAPLVFALFFAAMEFSRAYMVRHTLHNATYTGARRGLVPTTSNADIQQATLAALQNANIQDATINVSQTTDQVSVEVIVDYSDVSWVPPVFLLDQTIRARLTLEKDS